jgi:hypothetical protein
VARRAGHELGASDALQDWDQVPTLLKQDRTRYRAKIVPLCSRFSIHWVESVRTLLQPSDHTMIETRCDGSKKRPQAE